MEIKADVIIDVKQAQASVGRLAQSVNATGASINQVSNATQKSIAKISQSAQVSADKIKSIAVFMVAQSLGTVSAAIETYAGDNVKKSADYFKNAASSATAFAAALAPLGPIGIGLGAGLGVATGAVNTFMNKQREAKIEALEFAKALETQRQRLRNAVFNIVDFDKDTEKANEKTAFRKAFESVGWKDQQEMQRNKGYELQQQVNELQQQLQEAVGNKNVQAAEKASAQIIELKKYINEIRGWELKALEKETSVQEAVKSVSIQSAQRINVDGMQRIGATVGAPGRNNVQDMQLKEARKATSKLAGIENILRSQKETTGVSWN